MSERERETDRQTGRERKKERDGKVLVGLSDLEGPSFKIQCNHSNDPHEARTQNKNSLLRPSNKFLKQIFDSESHFLICPKRFLQSKYIFI